MGGNVLNSLIPEYGRLKDQEKELKSDITKTNNKIKRELKGGRELHAGDKVQYEAGEYVATLSVQDRSTTDADKLVARLKELGFENAIQIKEVPNEEAVETLIYEGKLSPQQIEDCIVIKEVETLTIKKKK